MFKLNTRAACRRQTQCNELRSVVCPKAFAKLSFAHWGCNIQNNVSIVKRFCLRIRAALWIGDIVMMRSSIYTLMTLCLSPIFLISRDEEKVRLDSRNGEPQIYGRPCTRSDTASKSRKHPLPSTAFSWTMRLRFMSSHGFDSCAQLCNRKQVMGSW